MNWNRGPEAISVVQFDHHWQLDTDYDVPELISFSYKLALISTFSRYQILVLFLSGKG